MNCKHSFKNIIKKELILVYSSSDLAEEEKSLK